MADCMKKGLTECTPIDQKKPQKTDEKTQRPMPMSKSVSESGKPGSFTIKR
jgi:hypothetical protein